MLADHRCLPLDVLAMINLIRKLAIYHFHNHHQNLMTSLHFITAGGIRKFEFLMENIRANAHAVFRLKEYIHQ